ncbi:hypothetical protein [Streptomyces sp.]|uniref:hypothetical protein n=1 Tax=Streptomyces sp. TaxID=1931 RepID=UPI002F948D77
MLEARERCEVLDAREQREVLDAREQREVFDAREQCGHTGHHGAADLSRGAPRVPEDEAIPSVAVQVTNVMAVSIPDDL